MMKNRAGLLALIVLAAASLLMVFFVLPRISQDAKPIGEAINAAGDAVKEAITEPQQTAKAPEAPKTGEQAAAPAPSSSAKPEAPAPSSTQPASTQPASQAAALSPSFDVLRVEPDGSTVIAGRAAPNSKLEITNGAAVVAKVDVGPSGDFAVVLDNPLPPGDHQLVLKATGRDGTAVTSEETATVSVPASKSGQLLAMVTKPGKASRVMTLPGQNPASPSQTAGSQAPAGLPATISPASVPAAAASDVAGVLPGLPAGSSNLASSAPNVTTASPTPDNAASADLRVTAVEIEGAKLFIAGITKPGTSVRGEADGKPIGTAKAGQDGSFVIEGLTDLSVGDHRISVESLSASGQALLRVEVPFNRPAGEQVAAVAGSSVATSMSGVDGGAFDKLRNETVRAFNLLKNLYGAGKVPSMEEVAAARSATGIALKSLAEYQLPADASAAARPIADAAAKEAAAALAALNALPGDVAAVGAGLNQVAGMVGKAVGPVIAYQLKSGAEMAAAAPAGTGEAAGAKTIQQAPLTQSERNSVIIRRGDTLWQISRRLYGQGVRYTTIYLANQDQIGNPDIIQPGQIFGVPEEFRPDSEELHRQRLHPKRS